jgi:nitric oxide reductase large subunit
MRAKMPETPMEFLVVFVVIAIVCVGACRLSRGFYWLAVPVALLFFSGGIGACHNDNFGGELIATFGVGYWIQYVISWMLPVIALSLYAAYDFKRRRVA